MVPVLVPQEEPRPITQIDLRSFPRFSTGLKELDRVLGGGIVPGSLILIGGDPGIGKCVTGDTRVLDPSTGDYLPIAAWGEALRPVLAVNTERLRLAPAPVAAFHRHGWQPVVEVRTALGRILRCTPSHPLLTPDGWQPVGGLRPGTRIAAPRALPVFGQESLPEAAILLIAYILSDGSAQSAISVTSTLPSVAHDLEAIAAAFGMHLRRYQKRGTPAVQYRFTNGRVQRALARQQVNYGLLHAWRRAECVSTVAQLQALADAVNVPLGDLAPEARERAEMKTPIARFLEQEGLRFRSAADKRVPACIFRLPREQLALFLRTLFSCDGSVYVNGQGQPGLSYATKSRQLAEDVQHLLLRFGIVAKLRTKRSRVRGAEYTSYEVVALGIPQVQRFVASIGILGAEAFPDPRLEALGHGDIYWDEIEAIYPAGEEEVYDISVPGPANFIAADLVVHNSTLLLQASALVAKHQGRVLYVSGEESLEQVRSRGDRLGALSDDLLLLASTGLQEVLKQAEVTKPRLLVLDSVQTIYSEELESPPGSISQVREVAVAFMRLAKEEGISTILIGHVTKDGSLAGPKALEHIVDAVIYFEGELRHAYRILRASKNRFGSTEEIGVFEMTEGGLVEVNNPSAVFLSERPLESPGSVVVPTVEGTRPVLVELQALVTSMGAPLPRRVVSGLDLNRASLLLAILEKRLGLPLGTCDVYLNVAGGIRVAETAADLALVAAVLSSFRNAPVDPALVIFGEVGLGGEVRGVRHGERRLQEAHHLGFARCILPQASLERLRTRVPIKLQGIRDLGGLLDLLFPFGN